MTRYRRTIERLRRPLAVVMLMLAALLLARAILDHRGVGAYAYVGWVLLFAAINWFIPARGSRLHPPDESTLNWARKRRRDGSD
jgi:hypothetical protein